MDDSLHERGHMLDSVMKRATRYWLSIACAAVALSTVHAQSVLIPSTTRRDLVFDFAGQNLYISNSTGIVQTLNLSTFTFGTSYNLGGSLNGLDIARDDSFLLVAQRETGPAQGMFQRIDLATGVITNINYTHYSSGETGAFDVGIGSNGLALVTTQYNGSGDVPLRQINLATNAITIRTDAPGSSGGRIEQNTQIHRSADGTRFFFMEAGSSAGSMFTYSAASNTFGPAIDTHRNMNTGSGAVNRDGTLVALRTTGSPPSASLHAPPSLNLVHTFDGIDGGVAFDATVDTFYGVNSTTDQIIAYSTQTFVNGKWGQSFFLAFR